MGAEAVEGLSAMLGAVKKADRALYGELRKAIKVDVGDPFKADVQARIREIGLVRSGRLVNSPKVSVTANAAAIRFPALNPSKKAPQGYAAIYEYRKDKPRPFINPTMDFWQQTGKTEQKLAPILDRAYDAFGG